MEDLTGQVIKSYVLRQLLGVGGFGAVYLAHQAYVERDVVIKIILTEYANHPQFIRRFESEAQLIARLEHLHIVPLYDYWREPGGAYLVMRWLRGGSLHDSLARQGPWEVDAVARLLEQMAAALVVAHRNGIVHRDLKPGNILLDDEGNAYLSDFGIASDLFGPEAIDDQSALIGTPYYMAPEQFAPNEPVTPQTDIYSLGVVLYTVLTGRVPFFDQDLSHVIQKHVREPLPPLQDARPDLHQNLNLVIRRATAKAPPARYPDALSMAAEFRELATLSIGTAKRAPVAPGPSMAGERSTIIIKKMSTPNLPTISLEPENPYKGLRAFQEADTADFFGREALVETLVGRLAEPGAKARFLAIVGPSGSGKSSVVMAGLLPVLRRGYISGSAHWFSVTMVPGPSPFVELEEALLRVASDKPDDLPARLREDEHGLLWAIERILPGQDTELLLIIDQFEELFAVVESTAERTRFLDTLTVALTDPHSRLRVVITLRADYYDRPLLHPGFGDLVRERTEVVLPLSSTELARVILRPAERVGVMIDRDLVAAIIADVQGQPGTLPLLQYALTELFEHREGYTLTQAAYQSAGGVLGALAKRADELYEGLGSDAQRATRQLFLRLVTLGDGAGATRQRLRWTELTPLAGGSTTTIQAVTNLFGLYRLLTFDYDPQTREPTVEIAHEALIQEWGKLRQWLDESREDLLVHRRLAAATAEWIAVNHDQSFLASGARLAQFEILTTKTDSILTEDERAYLNASTALRRRARQRLQLFIAALVVLMLMALGLAALTMDRQAQAEAAGATAVSEAAISRSRELAAASVANVEQLDLALLLSLEALSAADTFEARNSLLLALRTQPRLEAFLHGHTDWVRSVAFSPDGRTLASGSRDHTVVLWDVITRRPAVPPLTGHTDWVNSVAFSPDGSLVASGSADHTLRLWATETGDAIGLPLTGHTDDIWSVAFSPDGRLLASGSADQTVRVWDVATGQAIGQPLIGHEGVVYSVAFSPDGRRIASGGADNVVRLWDVPINEQPVGQPLAAHTNWVLSVAFSPDGQSLVSAGADTLLVLWEVASGRPIGQLRTGHSDWIRSVVFSPDGRLLASASADNTVRLWDVATGQIVDQPFAGHTDAVWSLAFSPDGRTLASGGSDNVIILWSLQTQSLLRQVLSGHRDPVSRVAFSPEGTLLASASGDPGGGVENAVRLWPLSGDGMFDPDTESVVLPGHYGPVTDLSFSPNGEMLASASADQTIMVWRMTGDERGEFGDLVETLLSESSLTSLAYSADSRLLASGDYTGNIVIWDVDAGHPAMPSLTGHTDTVTSMAFSPDGQMLASGSRDATIILWNTTTWEPVGPPLTGHADAVSSVAFSPNGQVLASGGWDHAVMLWDVLTRELIRQPLVAHTNSVLSVAFSSDGQTLASGSRDGTIILWDVSTGRPIGPPLSGHNDWVTSLAFGPNGQILASGSRDMTINLWDADLAEWQERACQVANRNFSPEEWARYIVFAPYHETCRDQLAMR